MTVNDGRKLSAQINMTPMIDVLLVLLVIFMVVTPLTSHGLDASMPQEAADNTKGPENPLVLTVAPDRTIELNHQAIDLDSLPQRLADLAKLRPNGIVFVRGSGELQFQDVAAVLDVVRGAGLLASLITK